MSASVQPRPVLPRPAMVVAGMVLAVIVAGAGVARWTGSVAGVPPRSEPVVARDLRFLDQADGTISVVDADSGRAVASIARGQDSFLRALMRGLAMRRYRAGLDATVPFRLIAWKDGRLTLLDPSDSTSLELEAFGATNEHVFARLLPIGEIVR